MKMNRLRNKIFAWMIIASLMFAILPMQSFAEEIQKNDLEKQQEESLGEDLTQNSMLEYEQAPAVTSEPESNVLADRKTQSIIVKFKDSKTENEASNILSSRMKTAGLPTVASNLEIDEMIDSNSIAVVSIGISDDMQSAINAISLNPNVEYVQQDYILFPGAEQSTFGDIVDNTSSESETDAENNESGNGPADSMQADLVEESSLAPIWAFKNEGQVINGVQGTAGIDINVESVYEGGNTFSEVIVAQVGTGIDTNHESLVGKTINGFDFVNMDTSVFDDNDSAHDTQIAAIIAGKEAGNGFRGVAANAKIIPLKFIEGGYGYTSDAIAAIEYAVDNGAKIINCAWGSDIYNPILKDMIQENSDILFVCASGNNGSTKNIYPAAFDLPNVISVASVDNTGNLAQSSNYGSTVDLASPGKDVYTAIPGDEYGFANGTSIGTAFVAAAAALYMGMDDENLAMQAKRAIVNSVAKNNLLTDKVASGGMLNVAEMMLYEDDIIFDDDYPVNSEIPENVLQLLSTYNSYTELSQEQRELLEKYLYLRPDTMAECAEAGYNLMESYQKALIMQKLNITLEQALTMIENVGEDTARFYSETFNKLQLEYEILNDYDKRYMIDLLIDGYEPYSVVYSYIAASALGVDHQSIISNIEPDFEALDLSGYSEDEIKVFKEIVTIYHLDMNKALQYLLDQSIKPTRLLEIIAKSQIELNMFIEHSNQALSDDTETEETIGKDQEAPFALGSNSNENINPQSGMLEYNDHIAKIPGRNGLDLDLTLRYDTQSSSTDKIHGKSEPEYKLVFYYDLYLTDIRGIFWRDIYAGRYPSWNAAMLQGIYSTGYGTPYAHYRIATVGRYDYVGQKTTNSVEANGMYGETPFESMGVGWAFKFPRVIIDDQTQEKSLQLASGSTYKYEASATHSNLKGYLLKDIYFEEDPNGQYRGSKYILSHINGTKEYFDGKGRIIGIRDKFNNTIDFTYNISGTYTGEVIITDSGSQITRIKYDNSGVTITLPDNNEVKYSFIVSGEYTLLNTKKDPMNRVTTYGYDTKTACFDFFSTDGNTYASSSIKGSVTHNLLNSITHPSGSITKYDYSVADGSFETKGFYQYFRVFSRYNLADGVQYNSKSYTYTTNNYTGFPTNKGIDNLDSSFEYETTVSTSNGVTKKYKFNNKHLLVSDSLTDNNIKKMENNYAHDSLKQILSHTAIAYGLGTAKQSVSEQYSYDDFGNLIASWGKEAGGNRNDTEYKKTFVYDPAYNMLTSMTYKKDNTTFIRENFELTSDKKSIANQKKYELIGSTTTQIAQTDFTYDIYGNALSKKEYAKAGTGILTGFGYQNGVFLTTEARAGSTKGYIYDILGRRLSYSDGNGNTTSYQYDKNGRLVKQINPGNPTVSSVTTIYDDANNTVTTTNEIGQKIKNTYDKLGNLKLVQDVTSTTITLSSNVYDNLMRLTNETDSKNTITTYTYDFLDRIMSKAIGTTALYTETFGYEDVYSNTQARITKTIEGDSTAPSVVTREYVNLYGNIDKKSRYINNIEYSDTFSYDYLGNNTQISTSDGKITKFMYDSSNRLIGTINPDTSLYQSTYDWLGRKLTTIDAKTKTAIYTYDDANNLVREELPFDGGYKTIKSHAYDKNGNITRDDITNNAPGTAQTTSRTDYAYDSRNWPTMVSQFDHNVASYITYTYDSVGNLTKMGMSNGAIITEYEYDKQSRLRKTTYPLSEIDPLNQFETCDYDTNGNLETKVDRNKNTTTYKYDALGRVTNITVKDKSGAAAAEYYSYVYSKTGALAQEKNEKLTTDFIYDDAGRVTKQTELNGIKKTYAYDIHDNRKSFVLTQNGVNKISQTYDYDNMSRLKKAYENGAVIATYDYDINGNRERLTYNANSIISNYNYNDANLVKDISNKRNGTTLSSFVYTYYLNGHQASKTDDLGRTTTYAYDDLGQLIQERETVPTGSFLGKVYSYDKAGNRKDMVVSGSENYTTTYTYDLNNRLTKEVKVIGTDTIIGDYYYDSNGNQVSKLTSKLSSNNNGASSVSITLAGEPSEHDYEIMSFDVFNRLIKADTNGAKVQYEYKPDGMRLSKTASGVKTTHIWDGTNIVLELGQDNNVTNKFIRGIDLIKSDRAGYYLYNEHGDVIQLANAGGTVTKRYHYDAFGVEVGMDASDSNPFRYCGEYFDKETKTVYLRARYYRPTTARMLSADTHWNVNNMVYGDNPQKANGMAMPDINAVKQSANLYTYCMNNPVIYTDSSGEAVDLLAIAGGVVIGAAVAIAADTAVQMLGNMIHGRPLNNFDNTGIFITGVVGGLSGGFGATAYKAGAQALVNGVLGAGGSMAQDIVHDRSINLLSAGLSGGLGALGGRIGGNGASYNPAYELKHAGTPYAYVAPYGTVTQQAALRSVFASVPASFGQSVLFGTWENNLTIGNGNMNSPVTFNASYQNSSYQSAYSYSIGSTSYFPNYSWTSTYNTSVINGSFSTSITNSYNYYNGFSYSSTY